MDDVPVLGNARDRRDRLAKIADRCVCAGKGAPQADAAVVRRPDLARIDGVNDRAAAIEYLDLQQARLAEILAEKAFDRADGRGGFAPRSGRYSQQNVGVMRDAQLNGACNQFVVLLRLDAHRVGRMLPLEQGIDRANNDDEHGADGREQAGECVRRLDGKKFHRPASAGVMDVQFGANRVSNLLTTEEAHRDFSSSD